MLLGHPVLFKSLCYVDGRWIHSDSAASIAVTNPADQQVIGHVPMLDKPQIVSAIDAADRAFQSWRWVPQQKRSALLLRWHELIMRHLSDLAGILSLEQGKPLAESKGEIGSSAAYILWFAEEGRRVYGDIVPSPWGDEGDEVDES